MTDSIDPIDCLLAKGLKPRDLIAHTLPSVDWLARNRDASFRLCYFGDDDQVIVEKTTAHGLIKRSKELGWTPNTDQLTEGSEGHMFDDAVYHQRRGVHWFATACDDTTAMLPLGFPAIALAASQKREERMFGEAAEAKRAKALAAKRDQQVKAQEKEAAAELSAAVQLAAADFMAEAEKAGAPITGATARRKAWKHIRKCDDWTYHLLLKRLREMHAKGAKA